MTTTAITNVSKIVTGDINDPVLEADAVLVRDGTIEAVGHGSHIELSQCDHVVDANGMILCPGLIDPHVHPTIGDWHPRQRVLDWMESTLHGGVTTLISQGMVHVSGRPTDGLGTKCLAIIGAKTMKDFRPGGGVKALFGSVILEEGLTEADFREMAENGVRTVAEIGGSGLCEYEDVAEPVAWARKYGMKVCMHMGAESIPGSRKVWADDILRLKPDVAVHVNGGSTAAPWVEIQRLIEESPKDLWIEVIYNGNPRRMHEIVELMKERRELFRLIIGSDNPIGIGFIPTAIMRAVGQISSLNRVPGATALAFGTGNTARAYGLNCGFVKVGCEADLLLLDAPLNGAGKDAVEAIEVGDLPCIAMIMSSGKIVATHGRNTPQGARRWKLDGEEVRDGDVYEFMFGAYRGGR